MIGLLSSQNASYLHKPCWHARPKALYLRADQARKLAVRQKAEQCKIMRVPNRDWIVLVVKIRRRQRAKQLVPRLWAASQAVQECIVIPVVNL